MTDDTAIAALLAAGQTGFSNALFTHYAELGLTPSEFVVYSFLTYWTQTHTAAPVLDDLAKQIGMPKRDVYAIISSLIQKSAIRLVTQPDAQGKSSDRYDVSPLIARVLTLAPATAKPAPAASDVFSAIEIEFGRPLSPIEQQTIGGWLNEDHYDPDLIRLALREAVLNQAYSLRYMDRILLNWERRHLTTVAQVQADEQRRNQI